MLDSTEKVRLDDFELLKVLRGSFWESDAST